MGSKYDWQPVNDGPGPGFYENDDNYKIVGGYIEPEAPRMYTIDGLSQLNQSKVNQSVNNITMNRSMNAIQESREALNKSAVTSK